MISHVNLINFRLSCYLNKFEDKEKKQETEIYHDLSLYYIFIANQFDNKGENKSQYNQLKVTSPNIWLTSGEVIKSPPAPNTSRFM